MDNQTATPASDAGTAAASSPPNPAAANPNPTEATAPATGEGQGNAAPAAGGETGKPESQTQPPAQVAPEKYEAFTLPEGIALEGERLDMAHAFAKANNWTQEKAQAGVDQYLKFREAELAHQRGLWGAQSEQEFGKDFSGIADGARRALVEVEKARPGITQRMESTNLGNHPDVLWLFNQLGLRGKEGAVVGFASQQRPDFTRRDLAERLYGNPPQK